MEKSNLSGFKQMNQDESPFRDNYQETTTLANNRAQDEISKVIRRSEQIINLEAFEMHSIECLT